MKTDFLAVLDEGENVTLMELMLLLPRGDVPRPIRSGDRQARRVVSGLIQRGVLTSTSDRAPLRLAFPAALAPRWLPGLFPDVPTN